MSPPNLPSGPIPCLAQLRAIGFAEWDPLWLLGRVVHESDYSAADHYDFYLRIVAQGLADGWSIKRATRSLYRFERYDIAKTHEPTARGRAQLTAAAILKLMRPMPDEHPRA